MQDDLDLFEAAFEFLVKAVEVFCARSYLDMAGAYGGPPVLGEEPETKRVRELGWERRIVDRAVSFVDGVPWDGVVDVNRDWSLLSAHLSAPLQLLAEAVRKAASPVAPLLIPKADARGLMIFPRFPFTRAGESVKSFSRWYGEVQEFAEDVRLAIERAKQEAGTRKTSETTETVDKPKDGLSRGSGPARAKRFRVALSFPGQKRDFLRAVADYLAAEIGRERVFYDKYYEAELARPDLDTYLQSLYRDDSDLIAVFLCADYEKKEWCGLEWRAIRELIKKRETSAIMPFRFDDTEIPGLFSIDGYISVADRSPHEVAALILKRLESNAQEA